MKLPLCIFAVLFVLPSIVSAGYGLQLPKIRKSWPIIDEFVIKLDTSITDMAGVVGPVDLMWKAPAIEIKVRRLPGNKHYNAHSCHTPHTTHDFKTFLMIELDCIPGLGPIVYLPISIDRLDWLSIDIVPLLRHVFNQLETTKQFRRMRIEARWPSKTADILKSFERNSHIAYSARRQPY